jgi:hypothetical protein
MDNLILLLQQEQLTALQWTNACNKLDTLTANISSIIQNTCTTHPIQSLTQRTTHQGGYLSIKLQKQWKKHLSTYHLIRKAIYILQNTPNWTTHPLILQLHTYPHTQIPPPPNDAQLLNKWIQQLSILAKTANKNARAITTKYTRQCVRKAISKYRRLYEISPKKINKIVFKNSETPPLDSLTNRQHNILTNPDNITNEIFAQQTISNRPTIPTCYYQPDHNIECTCAVHQYPWHDLEGFIINKRGIPLIPLHTYFTKSIYDLCLKQLA